MATAAVLVMMMMMMLMTLSDVDDGGCFGRRRRGGKAMIRLTAENHCGHAGTQFLARYSPLRRMEVASLLGSHAPVAK